MDRVQFSVVFSGGLWVVKLRAGGENLYATRKAAIVAAVEAAKDFANRGLKADVVVQENNNHFRCEYESTNDEGSRTLTSDGFTAA